VTDPPLSPQAGARNDTDDRDDAGRPRSPGASKRRRALVWTLRLSLVAAVAVFLTRTVAGDWEQVTAAARQLRPGWVALSLGFVVAGLLVATKVWQELLADLGSPLPLRVAARTLLVGQLGKYVPGSVFAVIAQTEMVSRHSVPRSRAALAALLQLALAVAAGTLLAVAALPVLTTAPGLRWSALALLACAALALAPPVLRRLLDLALRLTRRPPLQRTVTNAGLARAVAWQLLAWVLLGLHVWALTRGLDGDGRLLLVAVGSFALAWVAGFLVVVTPAGAGVREAVLIAALAPVVGAGPAVVVSLVSRGLMTLGDLVAAALSLLPRDAGPRRSR
jgi:glycosyltransferase 2 family protein